ncbi:SHOCT domain-containing protein [Ectobacillus polymachus]|uniref:SHOCT domain-containing protein n=1 Tax=Ectobacillus polymachus TaxID=1508806 RepID=UPI003A89EFFC
MGYGFQSCFGYGGGWIMMGGMLLFWLILIALLFMGYTKIQKSERTSTNQNEALAILKTRLAKSEITEEEYERLLQKLS